MLEENNEYYSYLELKEIVNSKGLKSRREYDEMRKSPDNIFNKKMPGYLSQFYANKGWVDYCVFFDKPFHMKKKYNMYYEYEECKMVVQSMGIKNHKDYEKKSKQFIKEDIRIPGHPRTIYKEKFEGWGIFLGTGAVAKDRRVFLPFEESREYARGLNFKTWSEWHSLKSEYLPMNVPKNPKKIYKDEFIDYPDWLGVDKYSKMSQGEIKVSKYLDKNNIEFKYNKIIKGCKNIIHLKFDFILNDMNVCIEFDGKQHYQPVDFGGGEEFEKTQKRDQIKNLFCEVNGIKLIRIPYWLKDQEIYELLERELLPIQDNDKLTVI